MQETIKLLGAIDMQIRKQSLRGTPKSITKKSKFPFAKVLNFENEKFEEFPKWLTEREDFLDFMYNNYENKLLSIPKICEKTEKTSDEKYFISLYIEQIPMFKNLPHPVKDIILSNIQTKYYSPNSVIHEEEAEMQFMAIIYVGSICYQKENTKVSVTNIKNDVIMTEAFYGKRHPEIIAKEETVLLTLSKDLYSLMQKKIMDDINEKSRDEIADLIKSDFFIELHLKDKKARNFFSLLKPEFYFKDENICNAGEAPEKFYIIFRGAVKELNHIYIREHNKWPLEVKRWEVRAVYNAFENIGCIKEYSFFGDEEIINGLKLKSTYKAETHLILFSIDKDTFIDALTNEDFKRLKKYRNEHININYSEFERSIRDRVKSHNERKKIIHKAIDTSFANRNGNDFTKRRISLVENFEKHMLDDSGIRRQRDRKEGKIRIGEF